MNQNNITQNEPMIELKFKTKYLESIRLRYFSGSKKTNHLS